MTAPCKPWAVMAAAALLATGCESFTLEPPAAAMIEHDRDDVVDSREIVVLTDNRADAADLLQKARAVGYTLRRRDALHALGLVQLVLEIPTGRTGVQAIRELEAMTPGVTAGVNHAYRPQAALQPRRYATQAISWPQTGCRAHHPIGIIDSGGPLPGSAVVAQSFVEGPSSIDHGAEIVALLLAPELGLKPQLHLAVVVSQGSDGGPAAGVDDIVRAIGWLLSEDVRIMNISLAGPYNKILDRAVQRAADRGALMVAAAGNHGPEAPPRYPAALRDVLAVTAVDSKNDLYADAVRGDHIDVAAPGVDVFIDHNRGTYRTGTSYAAPFVAAFFAVRDGDIPNPDEARKTLARDTVDLGSPGRDKSFGYGILSVEGVC